jgi:hypothetical protein
MRGRNANMMAEVAMRFALASVLLLAAGSSSAADPGIKADDPRPTVTKPPVNTVCPVDGNRVDPAIPPIAGKTKEGKTVMIATCGEVCAAKVREHPDAYADDAVANRKHADQPAK